MKKIIYVSLLDWYFTKQRPHHFAELLSKDYKILYICRASWQNIHLRTHGNDQKIKSIISVNDNLTVLRIKLLPYSSNKFIDNINNFYSYIIRNIEFVFKPYFLWLTHPEQYSLIRKKNNKAIIYDCMDNYSQFLTQPKEKKMLDLAEEEISKVADIIFTSSNGLRNKLKHIASEKKIKTVKNAADFNFFNKFLDARYLPAKPKDLPSNRKIIGYFGGISSWFDVDLVCSIAIEYSDCEVVIIGPISNKFVVDKTASLGNISWLGAKMYNDLPKYLYYFDVCIMPFIVNDLIKDVNPVKLYEYLSMGKPTVAPKYKEILEFEKYVYLADGNEDFINKVGEALNEEKDKNVIGERINYSRKNTWDMRAKEITKYIKEGYNG